jgi:hypothetical protein
MNYNKTGQRELTAIKTDGTLATPDPNTGLITFPSTGTWFIEVGSDMAPMVAQIVALSLHLQWSAALAAAMTFEWSNFAAKKGNTPNVGPDDIAANENGGTGGWLADPMTSGVNAATAIGAGNAFTAPTLTAGGTNAGAWGVQLADRSARRYRIKLVITVVGTLRVVPQGKLGS